MDYLTLIKYISTDLSTNIKKDYCNSDETPTHQYVLRNKTIQTEKPNSELYRHNNAYITAKVCSKVPEDIMKIKKKMSFKKTHKPWILTKDNISEIIDLYKT